MEDIVSLENDNKRKDALESRLEDLNKQDGWKETFRKIFSFADRLLRLRAEPEGIREVGQDCLHLVNDGWNSRCETRDVPLSDQFTLTPSSNGTQYSLYRQDSKGLDNHYTNLAVNSQVDSRTIWLTVTNLIPLKFSC